MQNQHKEKVFIHRSYFTLSELRDEWSTTDEHIRYLIENEELKAYLRPSLIFYTRKNIRKEIDFEPIPIPISDSCKLLHDRTLVFKYLYHRLREGKPIVGTKELLDAVGAQCHHLNNLFHNKPMWKELIIFPERGYCRLNIPDGVKIQHYQPSLFEEFE